MAENTSYVLLDFETTGLEASSSEIIEVGAIRVEGLQEVARYHTLVKPKVPIPAIITEITGITNSEVENAPSIREVAEAIAAFLGDLPIVAHNSKIEQDFLDQHVSPLVGGRIFTVHNSIDPMALLLPESHSHSMETLRNWAGVDLEDAHRADKDCLDLLKILQYSHAWMLRERPWMGAVVDHFLQNWWWSWFFRAGYDALETKPTLIELLERPFLGDLREFEKKDDERSIPKKIDVSKAEVLAILHGEKKHGSEKFAFRESQFQMSERVRVALENGERVAIEAPTGTGKSVAYLVPGVLAAEKTGSPLIVSTHSKALQDQLLEQDVPLVSDLLGKGPTSTDTAGIRATTVKGQENYLCLRKLHQECTFLPSDDGAPDSPATEERYCAAFVVALAKASEGTRARVAELDRVSNYLRNRFGAMNGFLEKVKAHFTTTKGPPCPFYKSCHYFDSARIAHQSDVVIANHSLVFHWPEHLPKIRNIVFDEAHHLEDQLTDAYEIALKETDLADDVDRLLTASRGRKVTDGTRIRRLLDSLSLPKGPNGETRLDDFLTPIQTRLREMTVLIPGALSRKGARDSGGYEVDLDLVKYEKDPVMDGLRNLASALQATADYLGAAKEAVLTGPLKTDPAADILQLHAHSMGAYAEAVSAAIKDPAPAAVKKAADLRETTPESPRRTDRVIDSTDTGAADRPAVPNFLRLLYWNPRENTWRIEVSPIEVKGLATEFFAEARAIALTSATLSSGANPTFVTDRIGLALSKPFASLPSPYPLGKQAIAFFPSDVSQPGTPGHLDAIIGFAEQTARILGGRTMLLMTANNRLRQAAETLRERLEKYGIQVFDSVSDRRAIDAFRGAERALLIGSERYGEGIDLPGRQLACVIIEKMNESMTRGPLAEARKGRTRFGLFDYDFPLRMIWLKQRVGRLIRSAEDRGAIVVFDPRFHGWSAPSKNIVVAALDPIPVKGGTRDDILMQIESMGI